MNGTSMGYDAGDSNHSLQLPHMITVDSPSKQGKYMCIDLNGDLKEIHYIVIQGIIQFSHLSYSNYSFS